MTVYLSPLDLTVFLRFAPLLRSRRSTKRLCPGGGRCGFACGSASSYPPGLSVRVEIARNIMQNMGEIREGINRRSVVVGGIKLDFHAYRLRDGTVNIGRITPPR